MPFKSKAQKDRFAKLLDEGRITQELHDKMAHGTPEELPERITPGTRAPKYIKKNKTI